MGSTDGLPTSEDFEAIAVEAGAIAPCEEHEHVMLDQFDNEAKARAYAIGIKRWNEGSLGGTRKSVTDGIQTVIGDAASDCYECSR